MQKLVETKGELGKSSIIVGEFMIALSIADRSRWSKNKEIEE